MNDPLLSIEDLSAYLKIPVNTLYQWLAPVGPSWWTDIVAHAHPNALPFGGASLPSFAAAFVLALVVGSVARRRVALA